MDLEFTKQIIKCLSGLDLETIKPSEQDVLDHFNEKSNNMLSSFFKNQKELLQFLKFQPDCIYEFNTFFGASHIIFYLEKEKTIYSLGSALNEPFSEYQVTQKLRRMGLNIENSFIEYCKSLPVVSLGTLNRLALMIYKNVLGNEAKVLYKTINIFEDSLPLNFNTTGKVQSKTMRKVEERYERSRALNEAVKQGNFSMAMQIISKYDFSSDLEVRNSSRLRNLQNYCIVINTQLRHSLEDSTIHPYELDKMSNEIGLKIEKLDSIEKAQAFMIQIIKQYCQLVTENDFPNLKPLIHLAVTYIKEHLSENITVKDTAEALRVNADYLSTVFKKEMGISFLKFVNKERIRQSVGLLKYSNIQIQEIAYIVGYNNTSYFAKQFKKEYNISPRELRGQEESV